MAREDGREMVVVISVNKQGLKDIIDIWFDEVPEVICTLSSIETLRANAIVSPANSFGFMDGGFDEAIVDVIGTYAPNMLRQDILDEHNGELDIGSYQVVETHDNSFPYLISAPTMRTPKDVSHTNNAYLHMRAVLKAMRYHEYDSVVMTVPCVGVGLMDKNIAAKQMRMAWQSMNRVDMLSMDEAQRSDRELYYL